MFANKYLNTACLSVFSLIFGIAMSLSLVNAQGEKGTVEQVVLNIHGMTSEKDAEAVKAALLKCNGVKDAKVSHKEATAVVTASEADYDELTEAVESAGFSVVEEE
jgi:copper chaperone CopZ